jgi:hypothetical protein
MTTKQTPGPWQSIHLHGKHYCVAEQKNGVGLLYNEANARLMAAAPELLAALRDVVEELKHAAHIVNLNEDAISKANAAIAKATGEPVMAA